MSHITPPPNPKAEQARAAMLKYKEEPAPIELTPAQLLTLQTMYPTLLPDAVIERGGFVITTYNETQAPIGDGPEVVRVTMTWKGRGQ